MEGIQAYDCKAFHLDCAAVIPIDLGGFTYLWCPQCRILANMQAISPKYQTYAAAGKSRRLIIAKEVADIDSARVPVNP